MKKEPENIVELRNMLTEAIANFQNDQIDHKKAKELSNLSGKVINSVKVQLEYHRDRKETPSIKFNHVFEKV